MMMTLTPSTRCLHWLIISLWAYCYWGCLQASSIDGYQLVWSDEFNIDGPPNPQDWGFEKGFVRNREEQYYQAQNAYCKNGHLVIEARRETIKNPNYKNGSPNWNERRSHAYISSASLQTKGKHHWKYGRFEIRAKFRQKKGLWPAIWFLGSKGEWPNCGEIDLFEYYDNSILANFMWGKPALYEPEVSSFKQPMSVMHRLAPQWTQKFHIWRMDWDEHHIDLYLDDVLINSISTNIKNSNKREVKYPFQQEHFILLNLALGGDAGGNTDKTSFPSQFLIDYVRVYQRK